MMINTSELEGAALDWAVARIDSDCEGLDWRLGEHSGMVGYGDIAGRSEPCLFLSSGVSLMKRLRLKRDGVEHYAPSTDWSQGGPLIENYGCQIIRRMVTPSTDWDARLARGHHPHEWFAGPTPLIAAMRAIVAAELGDEVDVPEELAASATA